MCSKSGVWQGAGGYLRLRCVPTESGSQLSFLTWFYTTEHNRKEWGRDLWTPSIEELGIVDVLWWEIQFCLKV